MRLYFGNSLLLLSLSFNVLPSVQACALDKHFLRARIPEAIERNNAERRHVAQPQSKQTKICNVRVFDGRAISEPRSIYINGAHITKQRRGIPTIEIDGEGGTLLPGLIDSHCHPMYVSDLQNLTAYGVTTAFSMATYTKDLPKSLDGHHGLAKVFFASAPAAALGSAHGNLTMGIANGTSLLVHGEKDADRWLKEQLSWDPAVIKIVGEKPGLDQATINRLTSQAHSHGKKVVMHAADFGSQWQGAIAGPDQLHHVPSDKPASDALARRIRRQGQISVPTLTVMKALLHTSPGRKYSASTDTVKLYHEAGIPILAGTDANHVISTFPFGSSLHDELQLMVEASLSPVDVLNAATSRAAESWGLSDRGVIAVGKRADLLLVDGDPTQDISAAKKIKKVWVGGQEYSEVAGKQN